MMSGHFWLRANSARGCSAPAKMSGGSIQHNPGTCTVALASNTVRPPEQASLCDIRCLLPRPSNQSLKRAMRRSKKAVSCCAQLDASQSARLPRPLCASLRTRGSNTRQVGHAAVGCVQEPPSARCRYAINDPTSHPRHPTWTFGQRRESAEVPGECCDSRLQGSAVVTCDRSHCSQCPHNPGPLQHRSRYKTTLRALRSCGKADRSLPQAATFQESVLHLARAIGTEHDPDHDQTYCVVDRKRTKGPDQTDPDFPTTDSTTNRPTPMV